MADLKPFTMPKWGIEMTEGTVAAWEIEEGKPFSKGDIIALIETDKITNEVEAEVDGCLVRLIANEQDTLPVGALLGVMGPKSSSDADIDTFVKQYKPASGEEIKPGDEEPQDAPSSSSVSNSAVADNVNISPAARSAAEKAGVDINTIEANGRSGRITKQDVDKALAGQKSPNLKGPYEPSGQDEAFASPLAKRMASQNDVDLSNVNGTGAKGRITKADVAQLIPADDKKETTAPTRSGEAEIRPMTSMRKTIAKRLTAAKQEIPHIYLRRRVRVDKLLQMRELAGKPGTINDYLLRACGLALMEVPAVNVQVHGDEIHHFSSADIAVAVATDRGLITPILSGADNMGIAEISKTMAGLAQRARSGKLQAHEFQGGSFSLSNLGAFGVEEFDAIINPPQGAILAVGAARPEPVEDDGAIRIVPMLHLSLSCDHRAIDGVDGAKFLEALAALIEAPEQL